MQLNDMMVILLEAGVRRRIHKGLEMVNYTTQVV